MVEPAPEPVPVEEPIDIDLSFWHLYNKLQNYIDNNNPSPFILELRDVLWDEHTTRVNEEVKIDDKLDNGDNWNEGWNAGYVEGVQDGRRQREREE